MTFTTDNGDVPLQWGQLWSQTKAVPGKGRSKKSKKKTGQQISKKWVISLLVLLNVALITATMVNADHSTQVKRAGEVQAMIAPTPVADSVEIKPIKAPAAVEAQVTAVKVEPTPTPVATVAAARVNRASYAPLVSNWDTLLQQYFGSAWLQAKRVMLCESGGNARAVGPRDSQGYNPIGLFQIKNFPGRPSTSALMDAATNIAYAAKMSGAGSSWRAWQCKP
jgi:hypothetical protein